MAAAAIPVPQERKRKAYKRHFETQEYKDTIGNYTASFGHIDSLLSVQQAASWYGVHQSSIRLWVRKGWIRAFKPHPASKVVRVVASDLLRVSESFKTEDPITHMTMKKALKQAHPRARMKTQEAPVTP